MRKLVEVKQLYSRPVASGRLVVGGCADGSRVNDDDNEIRISIPRDGMQYLYHGDSPRLSGTTSNIYYKTTVQIGEAVFVFYRAEGLSVVGAMSALFGAYAMVGDQRRDVCAALENPDSIEDQPFADYVIYSREHLRALEHDALYGRMAGADRPDTPEVVHVCPTRSERALYTGTR